MILILSITFLNRKQLDVAKISKIVTITIIATEAVYTMSYKQLPYTIYSISLDHFQNAHPNTPLSKVKSNLTKTPKFWASAYEDTQMFIKQAWVFV